MLLGGDELGRTQHGNNNAYCQDNEISWFDWEHVDEELLDFTRRVIHSRRTTRCSAAAVVQGPAGPRRPASATSRGSGPDGARDV